MKIQIKLEYNGKDYFSNFRECTEEDFEKAKDLIIQISEGKVSHLSMESGLEEYFFPKSILEKSIITIKKKYEKTNKPNIFKHQKA